MIYVWTVSYSYYQIEHTHGGRLQSMRAIQSWTWSDFRIEYENQLYSRYHRKMKEHEFLALRQDHLSVLNYERMFNDLFMFSSYHVSMEQCMIEIFRHRLLHDLKQKLIALQMMRDLIEATRALETCIGKGQQGQSEFGKMKDINYFSSKPHRLFFSRRTIQLVQEEGRGYKLKKISCWVFSEYIWRIKWGQSNLMGSFAGGASEQRTVTYSHSVRYEQRHPKDCSASPSQCYICRQEGHK